MNINKMYSDLSPNMQKDYRYDVAKVVGARAVKNSILGIVTTRKGSRPFQPEFGCDITDQLFENMTPLVADTIQRNIVSSIKNFEPRVSQLSVQVTPVYDDNSIIVTVRFSIVDDPDTLEQIRIQLRSSG